MLLNFTQYLNITEVAVIRFYFITCKVIYNYFALCKYSVV